MKRTLSVLLLVVLLASLLLPVAASAMANPFTRFVKTGNGKALNVRSGPGKDYEVLTTLPYRTMVQVVDTQGDWCLVEPYDIMWSNPMWVMKSFLVTSDPGPFKGNPTPAPTAAPQGPTYEDVDAVLRTLAPVATPYLAEIRTERPNNYVHLRWIPNSNARFAAQYLSGEKILVLAESQYWAQVMTLRDGYVGFILKKNVNPMAELQSELMMNMQQLFNDFQNLGTVSDILGATK